MKDPKKILWWADTASFVEWIIYGICVGVPLLALLAGRLSTATEGDEGGLGVYLYLIWLSLLRLRLLVRGIRMDTLRREIAAQNNQP
jgi:hypothetical protein